MRPFAYERAADAAGAVAAVAGPGAMFLGGGTNLVDLMKLGVEAPERLVDVSRLAPEIDAADDGGLRIGAGVRNSDLAADRRVRARYPVLAQSLNRGRRRRRAFVRERPHRAASAIAGTMFM